MNEEILTVTTPTYNRAHTLPECYRSLCEQTDRRFVWMIVDDGSADGTEALVHSWIEENRIPITYHKKENGGKASALNEGIELLDTEFAVCLDSDDTFYPETVELALRALEQVRDDPGCCGLLALRHNPDGTVMGGREIDAGYTSVTAADVFLKMNLQTELICFYKTSVLKNYRFPQFEGEKFVSPAWMQYKITQDYRYAVSRDKLCCCEYVADGLTKNKRKVILKNPRGYTCVKRWSFDLAPTLKLRVRHGLMYDCGCILGHDGDWLKNVRHKLLALALYPAAYILSRRRFRSV